MSDTKSRIYFLFQWGGNLILKFSNMWRLTALYQNNHLVVSQRKTNARWSHVLQGCSSSGVYSWKKPDSTYLILGYIWNEYHYKPSHFEFNSAVSAFWKLNSALLFSSVLWELWVFRCVPHSERLCIKSVNMHSWLPITLMGTAPVFIGENRNCAFRFAIS